MHRRTRMEEGMSMSTKEHAAAIRAELKKNGWSSRDVSVRAECYSMGSTIHVTIKNPGVPLSPVTRIAEVHERVDRCEHTGEILSGGNRFVRVGYDSRVMREMAAPIAEKLRTVDAERGTIVDVGNGWEAWKGKESGEYWYAKPIGSGDFYAPHGHIHCWGLEFCAEQLAARFVDRVDGGDDDPEPERAGPNASDAASPAADAVEAPPVEDAGAADEPDDGLTAHQRARRDRAERRVVRLHAAAAERFDAAHRHVAGIPMGQPILVGHHSERRHRRDLERHDSKMRQGLELLREAEHAERSVGRAGYAISSDDPEALDALGAKLAELEASRERMKRANAAWRRGRGDATASVAAMREAGFDDVLIARGVRNLQLMPCWTVPFQVTTVGAEIRRVAARIAEIDARAAAPERAPIEGAGFRIEEDRGDNRLRFHFETRPSREVCARMRYHGFRWSPTAGAWQRQLTEAAWRSALAAAREAFGFEG